MFRIIGHLVSRFWWILLIVWILLVPGIRAATYFATTEQPRDAAWGEILVGLSVTPPGWDAVVEEGQFTYLPEDVPSRRGEALFQQAFTADPLGSSIVMVLRRETDTLSARDRAFIENVLTPWLRHVAEQRGGLAGPPHGPGEPPQPDGETGGDQPRTEPEAQEPPSDVPQSPGAADGEPPDAEDGESIIAEVRTFNDPTLGHLLIGRDNQAALVIVELTTEFMSERNHPVIARIEQLIRDLEPPETSSPAIRRVERLIREFSRLGPDREPSAEAVEEVIRDLRDEPIPASESVDRVVELLRALPAASESRQQEMIMSINRQLQALRQSLQIPQGLDVALSGSAVVGRDMRMAAAESAEATETTTVILVIILLILIYRAPILAIIPLTTVYLALKVALAVLALSASAEVIRLFNGLEIYVTVVLYGAGVDYCMFLMARYKEELNDGSSFQDSMAHSVRRVGAALAASAGTTIVGIGMMAFAEFGKFQQAGVAMAASLVFVLLAALTFAPSLLRLAGHWAFWPDIRTERITRSSGWLSPTNLVGRLLETGWFQGVWERVAQTVRRRPGTVWLSTVALMAPFAAVAVLFFDALSYGLISELPQNQPRRFPSPHGIEAVQQHFPAGITGPVTILVQSRQVSFRGAEGLSLIDELTERLHARKDELDIANIRSIAAPLGGRLEETVAEEQTFLQRATRTAAVRQRALPYYVADRGELAGHVTRIDVVFQDDPFSRGSIRRFNELKETVRNALPDELKPQAELYYIGATASIRDLKAVTSRDQVRIEILAVCGVFIVLVALLRRVAIAGYLIVSVLFSFLVTLGVTFAFFWALDPAGFTGLDWKVPMFLFTILIAVGEDYNIYLMTRIEEEQRRHGMVEGVTVGLLKTAAIVSACGIIMAGTFSSLMAGSLMGMIQLGFALALGVLLDTFVVRPILVPSYLVMLHEGRFGALGRFLGAEQPLPRRKALAEHESVRQE